MAQDPLNVVNKNFMEHFKGGELLLREHIVIKETFSSENVKFCNYSGIDFFAV